MTKNTPETPKPLPCRHAKALNLAWARLKEIHENAQKWTRARTSSRAALWIEIGYPTLDLSQPCCNPEAEARVWEAVADWFEPRPADSRRNHIAAMREKAAALRKGGDTDGR